MTSWLRKEGCNNLYLKPEWPQKGTKTPSIKDPEKLQKREEINVCAGYQTAHNETGASSRHERSSL